jgi:hypothetical protein
MNVFPVRAFVALALPSLLLSSARCSFPQREFDDARFAETSAGRSGGSAGGVGGAGASGASGAGAGGAGAGGAGAGGAGAGGEAGGAGAGTGGEAGGGAGGEAGGGAAGAGGEAGAGGLAGAGGDGGTGGAAGTGGAGGGCVEDGKKLSCGQGECAREVVACVDGLPQSCTPGLPKLEVCENGLDDNCNGQNDEYCAGNCAHDICVSATKLKAECSPCVGAICETGKFAKCCVDAWGPDCLAAVSLVCNVAICKGFNCAHAPCVVGAPLNKSCDYPSMLGESCVTRICNEEPGCCETAWGDTCVQKVNTICGLGCSL